jgi:hypothetical protein
MSVDLAAESHYMTRLALSTTAYNTSDALAAKMSLQKGNARFTFVIVVLKL